MHLDWQRRGNGRTDNAMAVLPAAVLIFIVGGIGENTELAALAIAVLIAGTFLLWRPGEAPALLILFGFAWIAGSIGIFHANWLGRSVNENALVLGATDIAVILTLLGILALAIGMRLGAGAPRPHLGMLVRQTALSQPERVWFRLYILSFGASLSVGVVATTAPGIAQVIIGLVQIRWAFFFMFAFANFVNGGGWRLFWFAFLLEFVFGIGGFFSEFKTVFLVTLAAVAAAGTKVTARRLVGTSLLMLAMVAAILVWTAVKNDYRAWANRGEATQVVAAGFVDRMEKLGELVGDLDETKLVASIDQMVRRLGYVEFFGVVLNTVPALVPHEWGAIFTDALIRPFMPRILFSDKTAIDDSARTNLYTGGAAGNSEATSISLGYVAEMYVDFGSWGMMLALCVIGYLYGVIYRYVIEWPTCSPLFGMSVVTVTFLVVVGSLDQSFTKAFGGVVAQLLAAWLVAAFVLPRWVPWLTQSRRR